MRAARAVTSLIEIETQAAELVASWLPEPGFVATTTTEADTTGQGLDLLNTTMAEAGPRAAKLARALALLSRMVRHDIALQRRIEAGWTGTRADTKAAMTKRQVARQVGEAIRRETDGEAAERLFDDLYERLEDPAMDTLFATMPVEDMVRQLCHELGLAVQALEGVALGAAGPRSTGRAPPQTDTG